MPRHGHGARLVEPGATGRRLRSRRCPWTSGLPKSRTLVVRNGVGVRHAGQSGSSLSPASTMAALAVGPSWRISGMGSPRIARSVQGELAEVLRRDRHQSGVVGDVATLAEQHAVARDEQFYAEMPHPAREVTVSAIRSASRRRLGSIGAGCRDSRWSPSICR